MPWLIRTNFVFLFLFGAVFFLPLDTSATERVIRSTIELSFIFILTFGIFFFHKKRNVENIFEFPLDSKALWNTFFSKNFLFPFILYIAVVVSITAAYYPLPDLDPYYWVTKYQSQFQGKTIT